MSYQRISFEIKDKTAYVGFGKSSEKSMTTLTKDVLEELNQIVDEITDKQKELSGVIFFSHIPNVFIAGADIELISTLKTEKDAAEGAKKGQDIYNKIEDLKINTVSCVDGPCLGGGLELALSCDFILASNSPKTVLGLPEVMLGLLPGFGGTYRLPRKIGLINSLDMILSGKKVKSRKAKKMGLVEEFYQTERLLEIAPKYVTGELPRNRKPKFGQKLKDRFEDLASDNFIGRKVIFQKAREGVMKKTKGFYQAPLKILDLLETGIGKRRSSYLNLESNAFGELCASEQSRNLIHLYFLAEGSKKYNGKSLKDIPNKIKRGGVLGAGTMGGGIAWLFANNKQAPIMKDITKEALELGLKQSSENFHRALKRRRIKKDEFENKQRSIIPTLDYQGFKCIDLVIEAVVENMDLKKRVFSELEKEVDQDCVITSNTSSLSVEEMSTALEYPERFAGLHFFNPVHRMPLVEIITHDKVSDDVVQQLHKWCLSVKKTPVIVKDGPGFLVNRILGPYLNEAAILLEEGVPFKKLEDAALNFGMPMGPLRLMDEVGIDVADKVAKILNKGLGDRITPSSVAPKLLDINLLGKKGGKGFYLYDSKGKETEINQDVLKIYPGDKDIYDEVTLQMRMFLPMINEASMILEEGKVKNAGDVDLGMIFGTGFPPFRGGLLKYADTEGLDKILESLEKYSKEVCSKRFAPSELLKKLVVEKKKFYDL